MKTRAIFTFGLSALVLGGSMVGCAHQGGMASASARNSAAESGQAGKLAEKADKALAKHKTENAVEYAEGAVSLQPRNVDYRVLLGKSYLYAGRFTSAHAAFADALSLDATNGPAALNMALAQTAEGDWAGARKTLIDYAAAIPAVDRGLALALAGDPADAVMILTTAARTPGADAKTRQNLALSLALAGDWRGARSVASVDLSPAAVDQRLTDWAAFASPTSASDQVSSLLGVEPVKDPGLPVALALNGQTAPVAVAAADPVDAYMPAAAADPDQPAPEAAALPEAPVVETPTAAPQQQVAGVTFGPRDEVVQAVPVEMASVPVQKRMPAPRKASTPASRDFAKGNYFVQLGAYENAAVARDAWGRIKRRYGSVADVTPSGMNFVTKDGSFYRLSVGGYAKADANTLCRRIKSKGGRCFVRTDGGDQMAQWMQKREQLASR